MRRRARIPADPTPLRVWIDESPAHTLTALSEDMEELGDPVSVSHLSDMAAGRRMPGSPKRRRNIDIATFGGVPVGAWYTDDYATPEEVAEARGVDYS